MATVVASGFAINLTPQSASAAQFCDGDEASFQYQYYDTLSAAQDDNLIGSSLIYSDTQVEVGPNDPLLLITETCPLPTESVAVYILNPGRSNLDQGSFSYVALNTGGVTTTTSHTIVEFNSNTSSTGEVKYISPQSDEDVISVSNIGERQSYFSENSQLFGEQNEQAEDGGIFQDNEAVDEATEDDDPVEEDTTEETTFSCAGSAGPLGWILCPVANGLLDALDAVAGSELQQLLQINAEVVDDPSVSSVVDNFRTFANTALIIGFLFIIFAQALSLGVDAYTIKRMLPRLALAVIAVQLSTPIAQILIDFFNVLGLGIADLILSTVGNESISLNFNIFSPDGAAGFDDAFGRVAQGGAVLAGTAAAGSAIWALILALPTILIVVVITVAMLIIRRLVLVMLIILAPLAMAAWVLPNTEKWAKEWFDTFIKILLMFPLIIGFIAMGKFMASVNSVAVGATDGASLTFIDSLITLLAAFGPYLLIPFTYQFAGKLFGSLGSMAGKLQGRALGGGGGSSGGGSGQQGGIKGAWQNRVNKKRAQMAAGQTKLTRGNGSLNTYIRRASAPGMNVPFRGKSRSRADTIARQANRSMVAQGAKELEEQGLSGDKEALRALWFAGDKDGDKRFDEFLKTQKPTDAAKMRATRDEWRTRLSDDPSLVQAAQLQSAQLGDVDTKEKVQAMADGFRGTSELQQSHFDQVVGGSMGAGVHQAAGWRVTPTSTVDVDQGAAAGAVSSRTGQQIIRTNKSQDTTSTVAGYMHTNLTAVSNMSSADDGYDTAVSARHNTVQQAATVLTSDETSPELVNQVRQKVYNGKNTTDADRQEIDAAMSRIRTGSN